MNNTVYTAVKAPITRHPQKCRIGVCNGTPTLEEGWILFSSIVSEDAEEVYAHIAELLDDIRETNYDAENAAWMVPVNALDKWMTSRANHIQRVSSDKHQMKYIKHL